MAHTKDIAKRYGFLKVEFEDFIFTKYLWGTFKSGFSGIEIPDDRVAEVVGEFQTYKKCQYLSAKNILASNSNEESNAARERHDKAISIFKNIKTPYYTSDPNKRGYPEKNALPIGVQGVEDPFFEQFNKIYPGQGLKGFREENPKLFTNSSRSDIDLASEKYEKVNGICTIIREWFRIPLIVGLVLLFPVGTQHMPPLIYCFFAYSIYVFIIEGILKMTDDSRASHDNKIFDARCRLAKDLGLLKEEDFFKERTLKESFKFDYGIEVDDEKNEE